MFPYIYTWGDLLMFVVTLYFIVYLYSVYQLSYWKKKGVSGPDPKFFFGNIYDCLLKRKSLGETIQDIYFATKELPYVGIYLLHKSALVINNLDIIKTILIRDFAHFKDHNIELNPHREPLSEQLFHSTGDKWKAMRSQLTPTFTSSKIKYMYDTIVQCSEKLKNHIDKNLTANNNILDMKELIAKFNTDVIVSVAFGIDSDSFSDPKEVYRRMGKKVSESPGLRRILELPMFFGRKTLYFFRNMIGREFEDFFYKTVSQTMKYRKDNNIVRKDFLQLMMDLKVDKILDPTSGTDDQKDGHLTTMQIAAQAFIFFVAGYETSSLASSFSLYELALNQDIQDKVRQEIRDILSKYNGTITYDALAEMTYIEQVIQESMRKYPPLPILFRVCTKDYTIPDTNITIEKDTPIFIPLWGIQMDPDIFSEPQIFDPDRFSPENIKIRHAYSFMPFGEGPRICIGKRFGMMQAKLAIVTVILVNEFSVSRCSQTLVPMEFTKPHVQLNCEDISLKLEKL